jgi:class 3 adenylate cyclase/HAMP domain-containing protein
MNRYFRRLGVGGRLLMAFLGISGFAVLGAGGGVYAFLEISDALRRITQERVPYALAAQAVSRQAERVVAAAPTLLSAATRKEYIVRSRQVAAEVDRLDRLIVELKGAGIAQELGDIELIARQLRVKLWNLDRSVIKRLTIAADKEKSVELLQGHYREVQQLLEPWLLVTEARIAKWRETVGKVATPAEQRASADANLKESLSWLRSLHEQQLLLTSASETVQRLAKSGDTKSLRIAKFRLTLLFRKLQQSASRLDPKLRPSLLAVLKRFAGLANGSDGILSKRQGELVIIANAEESIRQNAALSRQLTVAVNKLVGQARNEIRRVNREASLAQTFSLYVMIAAVALSLLCSVLIVWLYVGRNLIARLTELSDSMLAIAGGNLQAPLPGPGGNDEISRMAKALTVFRDTAVEVEEKNLREIEGMRRRLIDAIEHTSEGFAFYDDQDRLELCNTQYEEMLYPGMHGKLVPGTRFESIIREAAESGLIPEAEGRIEEWVAERLERHHNPGEPHVHQLRHGLWLLISERKTATGGTVAVYADISELKQREEELAEKSDALEQKSGALEQLSNQLAKYLSPQVYDSIFRGKQEVKVASSRKKLTIFFSDIAGFTETADRLESEELTVLLNHYLTEMSKIALGHGATVDKYVGDAIVIFFGDPESKGVKDDALYCVQMAIAMRKRMLELEDIWRGSGIEQPLRVRMGIHTGFCTVGNFGSDDRLDYTIIGGAVNTASRLESVATPGEILISYETFSQVSDNIACEEHGQVTVKGLAYPVAAYRVVDTYENLQEERRHFCEDRPKVKVDLDIETMTNDDRSQATAILQRALEALSNGDARQEPKSAPKTGSGRRRTNPRKSKR